MPSMDAGRDLHEWETEYAALEEALHDDPREALPELFDLVERMLRARNVPIDDPVAEQSTEEIPAEFEAVRDTVQTVRDGGDVPPGDVARAVNGLEDIYATLVAEMPGP